MKKFARILPYLRNKYVISVLGFAVWMVFFDRNDLISQISYRKQLNKLEADKDYYLESIEESKRSLHQLMSDPDNIEKFARERYLMKRDDEDIFLIIHDEDGGK